MKLSKTLQKYLSNYSGIDDPYLTALRLIKKKYDAQNLRKSIYKKAFEGKLVTQDLNDENASVLLKRIIEEKASIQDMI